MRGLAWTSVGGDTLQIEAVRMPGKGELRLTGQMGDVMKESAFFLGTSTLLIPAILAASIFSFSPPMGSTLPRSVISPVMARSALTGIPVSPHQFAAG